MSNYNHHPRQLVLPRANWEISPATPYSSPVAMEQPIYQPNQQQMMVMAQNEHDQKRVLDALTTKLARTKRKISRQIRAQFKSSSGTSNAYLSSSSSSSCSDSPRNEGLHIREEEEQVGLISNNEDIYTFFTPDNKRLRLVLKKELKKSDVGSLGRIVLPKKEAEDNLPSLVEKEGIKLIIKDIYSNKEWCLRYKYWSNNKSRMYVLEHTVDFVRQNRLEMGDSVFLYEDECKNLYYLAMKKNVIRSTTSSEIFNNNISSYVTQNATKELCPNNYYNNHTLHSYGQFAPARYEQDMAYLETSNQQLNQQEANNIVINNNNNNTNDNNTNSCLVSTFSHGHCNDNLDFFGHPSNNVSVNDDGNSLSKSYMVGDEIFDDCFEDLGTLPEVDFYNRYSSYYGGSSLFDDCSDY